MIGTASNGSGSCNGGGRGNEGKLRPRGPSGEDCSEVYAGVDDNDGPVGLMVAVGVMLDGNSVTFGCMSAC